IRSLVLYTNRKYFPDELLITMNKENPAIYDLYHLNLVSNEITLLHKNPGNIIDWLIDNNMKLRGVLEADNDGLINFMLKDEDNSEWIKLLTWKSEERPLSRPLSFSKDNKHLYLVDNSNYCTGTIVKMDLRTGKTEIIASHPEYDIFAVFQKEHLYKYDIRSVIYNQDTYEIQAVSFDKFRKKWLVLDEKIKDDVDAITKLDRGDFFITSRSEEDDIWVIGFEKDDGPMSYYVFYRNLKKGNFLFDDNPELNDYILSHMEEITFKSRDGLTLHGYITYPPVKSRKKLPVVLFVHSGPARRDFWGYNPTVQLFSNRGYVCLQVNYRGSIGYGKAFLNAGNKEWGGKIQDDLVDAVRWVIAEGIGDPAKIAIYGSGFGGYAALVGATDTPDLFCCAIAIQSPGNLVTFLQSLPPHFNRKEFIKKAGDPYNEEALLLSRSPLYKLEQIKIPILIAYGLKDSIVKPSEPYKIITTLKGKGIEVEQVVFPDEGHELINPKNRMKLHAISEKFLARYLGGRYEEREIPVKEIYISSANYNTFNYKNLIDKVIREGDGKSFERLVDYYRKPLLKHLFNLTGNREVSVELFQETLSKIWLYMESYSFDMPFHSWMFKIAENTTKDYRRRKYKLNNEVSFDEIDVDEISSGYENNVEDKLFIQSVINSLREPYRTSLKLRVIDELDYKEIAFIMNTNQQQIKNYLFRAKKFISKSWLEFTI
ncbi:MAG: sigma-70 family RNA polymerase sigma factor, partial [Candidatus Eremiobacterota bacterium]